MKTCCTTERLCISEHEWCDAHALHTLLSDETAMYYLPEIRTKTFNESEQNLREAIREQSTPDRTKYFYKISTHTDIYIGEIGCTVIHRGPDGLVVNLGYFILKEFWNKGILTEAARSFISYCFSCLGVVRIETGCLSENRASERVMKKCGFIREAVLEKHVLHDAVLKDRVEYALERSAWLTDSVHVTPYEFPMGNRTSPI